MNITSDDLIEVFPTSSPVRKITFSELKNRPALFLEKLFEANPELHEQLEKKKKTLSAANLTKNAIPPGPEKEKFYRIVDQLESELSNLMHAAESCVLSFLDNPNPTSQTEYQQPEIQTHSQPINSTELLYRAIGMEMLLNGNYDRVSIARKTNIPLSTVISTCDSAEFATFLDIAQSQMTQTGLLNSSGRLRELLRQYAELESVRMKRALCATRPDQVSDEELIRIGISPQMRDLQMALEPGADSGIFVKRAVVMRAMSSEGGRGGNRTELVYTYELDSTFLNQRKAILAEISKEQESQGTKNKPARKVYGFDTEGV